MDNYKIFPIKALESNYIWILETPEVRFVIDPGEAGEVSRILSENPKTTCLLLTHRHSDHIGGVGELQQAFGESLKVYAPEEVYPQADVFLPSSGSHKIGVFSIDIYHTPGHTREHVIYSLPEIKTVFCGDLLFASGCGRVFEGTYREMLESLRVFTNFADSSTIYPAHEYSLTNANFACRVEPNNHALQKRQHEFQHLHTQSLPSLPVSLQQEWACNPFLRCLLPAIPQEIQDFALSQDPLTCFAALRDARNKF